MSGGPVSAGGISLPAHTLPDAPHWRYALALYGHPGVAPACLVLQEALGLDVNVLLLSLYASERLGRAPTLAEVADADGRVAAWRRDVVQPLRAVRQRLKAGPAPAPSDATQALRGRLQFVEIEAEYLQQQVLAEWAASLPPVAPADAATGAGDQPPGAGAAGQALSCVVAFYAGRQPAPTDGWRHAVDQLHAVLSGRP